MVKSVQTLKMQKKLKFVSNDQILTFGVVWTVAVWPNMAIRHKNGKSAKMHDFDCSNGSKPILGVFNGKLDIRCTLFSKNPTCSGSWWLQVYYFGKLHQK